MTADDPRLATFDARLKRLLEIELRAGNSVCDVGAALQGVGLTVRLARPFTTAQPAHAAQPDCVEYREVNDPHWWKDEFVAGNDRLTGGFD